MARSLIVHILGIHKERVDRGTVIVTSRPIRKTRGRIVRVVRHIVSRERGAQTSSRLVGKGGSRRRKGRRQQNGFCLSLTVVRRRRLKGQIGTRCLLRTSIEREKSTSAGKRGSEDAELRKG